MIASFHDSASAARSIHQTTEAKRETRRELARSVFAMIRCHGHSIRQVGRNYGLADGEVLDMFLEAESEHESALWMKAYREGRLANFPPVTTLRRAA